VKHWTLFYCEQHRIYNLRPGIIPEMRCPLNNQLLLLYKRTWNGADVPSAEELAEIKTNLARTLDVEKYDIVVSMGET
jgi:hypothetical protein